MKEIDEKELKGEIDEISRKIDSIIKNIEDLNPAREQAKIEKED